MIGLERKKYTGDLRNGMPHGHGICEFTNGDRYVGEFRDGKFEGCGILTFGNGDRPGARFRESMAFTEERQVLGEFEKWIDTIFIEN
ncbi:MAG: repeat-containing protein [Firmicutes bacterium]|nr:repeat-containing protein [Bacillota bacterium]